MKKAYSFDNGIIINDYTKHNAIYGYYHNGEVCFKIGQFNALYDLSNQDDNSLTYLIMKRLFIIDIVLFLLSLFQHSFYVNLCILLFMITSFIPLSTILLAIFNQYSNSFKRYHGCEHKFFTVKGELTYENLKDASIYHGECGSMYACSAFIALLCIFLTLVFISHIGLIWFVVINILMLILLFLNFFNPYNPFFIIQRFLVEEPTDYELNLLITLIEKYDEID